MACRRIEPREYWRITPEPGRNRLRTVLNRLRRLAGPLLEREGGSLVVGDPLRIDLVDFLAEAARARALASTDPSLASAVARTAIARYHGKLLPEDAYEDWAELPRQRAHRALLELLDLTTSEAARDRRLTLTMARRSSPSSPATPGSPA